MLDGAWTSNEAQNGLVLRKLGRAVRPLKGARIAVLGLTYKPDTSTLRRSASLEVIGDLIREGVSVTAHDPQADRAELAGYPGLAVHDDPYVAIRGSEALVLMTPWRDYRDLDFELVRSIMKTPYIFDSAGLWDAERIMALGFTYEDIGRGRHARMVS